ncbi:MAG: GNAT family N-acyltransferase, partial [Gammaproteobacteria bacterium]
MHTGTPVLPVHIGARNSARFYGVSTLAKPLATAMLPREAVAWRDRSIRMRVGTLINAEEIRRRSKGDSHQAARLMRRHVYRLARGHEPIFSGQTPLAQAEPANAVGAELQQRGELLAEVGKGHQIWLFPGTADGVVMRELGRLRELTFRKVGEGTGLSCDLDAYDAWYEHLILWDNGSRCIVGAYRLGHAGRILEQRGLRGLYSASLFDFTPKLSAQLATGLGLDRSFITPVYWHSHALSYLWHGIGLYLLQHKQIRYLFGPVSLSVNLPLEAREWIVAAHQHYFSAPGLASAHRPFRVSTTTLDCVRAALNGLDPIAGLKYLRHHLDALGVTYPVLYRKYVDLVEPEGVRFLDFGEDPMFSGCVDGMLVLDLAYVKPAKRARYQKPLGAGASPTGTGYTEATCRSEWPSARETICSPSPQQNRCPIPRSNSPAN